MRFVQYLAVDGQRQVGVPTDDGQQLQVLRGITHVYHLAQQAHRQSIPLAELATAHLSDEHEDYGGVVESRRLLAPLDHPTDAAHFLISGTGLDHTA